MVSLGKNSYFSLDNGAGTLVDLTTKIVSIDVPRSLETSETSTMGATPKTYIATKSDASIALEMVWDTAVDTHIEGIFDGREVSFEYGVAGSGTGNKKLSGEAIVTEVSLPSDQGSHISFSVSLQVTAGITNGVFA